MKINKGIIKLGKIISSHSPEILTAVGVIGMVSAGISAVKNTPKALDIIDRAKDERGIYEIEPKEVVKLCWKQYIFPVSLSALSIGCIIFARKIDAGRTAALVTACKISEEAADRFENEANEVIGEKGITKVKDKIAEKDLGKNPIDETEVINTGSGDSLYFEKYSSRYFRASREYIDHARNTFNAKLLDFDSLSINDWLECLGLPYLDDETTGSILGWRIDDVRRKCGGHMLDIEYSYHPASNGEPCGHICMDARPIVNYS